MVESNEELQPRKSLYMRIAPIVDTYEDVIRKKLESGRFPFTNTGIIKVVGMLCLIGSLGLFFGTPLCDGTANWYPYLFPSSISTTLILQLFLYIIFSSGCTTVNPGLWVTIDIIMNLCFAILSIISSVLSMVDCGSGVFSQIIIGALGICGCIISVIGCIAMFLMYRFVDEGQPQTPSQRTADPRKSVFA